MQRCQSLSTQASSQDYWISFPREFEINELPSVLSNLHTDSKFRKSYVQGLDDKLTASTKNSSRGEADLGFVNGILFLPCDGRQVLSESTGMLTSNCHFRFDTFPRTFCQIVVFSVMSYRMCIYFCSYVLSHRLLWEWRCTEILKIVSETLRHINGSFHGQSNFDMIPVIQYLASV